MKNYIIILSFVLGITTNQCMQASQDSSMSEQIKPAASIFARMVQGEILSARDKKASFIEDCAQLALENNKIAQHPHDGSKLRVATYNVHVWANPYFKFPKNISQKLSEICDKQGVDVQKRKVTPVFDVIDALDADVLILQEAASDNLPEFEDYKKILYAMGYVHGLDHFANMNNDAHSQYGPFGNWILSRYPFEKNPRVGHYAHQYTGYLENKDEYVDRCFENAIITLPSGKTCSFYATHLDAFDDSEQVRFEQIKELALVMQADESDHVILAGDLNSVRREDYTEEQWNLIEQDNAQRLNSFSKMKLNSGKTPTRVMDYLKEHGFVDCFTKKNMQVPQFTTWSGTTIDFMMIKDKYEDKPLLIDDCAVYYSSASDHIPVIADFKA